MFHAPLILCCTKSYEVGVRSLHSHQRSLFLPMPYVCFRHSTVAGNSASSFLSALGRLWPSMSCQCHSGRGTRGPCQSAAKRRGNLRTNTAPMTCKKINSLTAFWIRAMMQVVHQKTLAIPTATANSNNDSPLLATELLNTQRVLSRARSVQMLCLPCLLVLYKIMSVVLVLHTKNAPWTEFLELSEPNFYLPKPMLLIGLRFAY